VTPDGADVRATVETIRALNDIDSSLIVPGQVLKVPVVD
jgi:LysM repeat protein